ncbi:MAG: hypothetical protein ACKOBW_16070 [Planctomycetota bacterium]
MSTSSEGHSAPNAGNSHDSGTAPSNSAASSTANAASGERRTKSEAARASSEQRNEQQSEQRGLVGSIIRSTIDFVTAVVSAPLVMIRGRRDSDSLIVYTAHPSFYLWMLILTGFVLSFLVRREWISASSGGWLYIWVLVYSLFTLIYDLNTRRMALWSGIFLLLWLLSKYVEHVRNIAVIGNLSSYLTSLDPKLDPGTVTVLSWLLLIPWLGSLAQMVMYGRKRFTPNEIGEFHFGEGHELTDRMGLRFRTRYRDLLETLLTFGGGDLLAVDNHQNVIKRWDNVIGLFFAWPDLDRILHQRSVMDQDEEELLRRSLEAQQEKAQP